MTTTHESPTASTLPIDLAYSEGNALIHKVHEIDAMLNTISDLVDELDFDRTHPNTPVLDRITSLISVTKLLSGQACGGADSVHAAIHRCR